MQRFSKGLRSVPSCLVGLALLMPGACQPGEPAPLAEPPAEAPIIRVTVLGSGVPVPSRSQTGAAILVETGGETLLFDCGRGCTTRLAQYEPDLLTQVDTVFLTHLHSDHVVGLPDLWLNGWTQGRSEPFRVWGPEGTGGLFDGLEAAFDTDISIRLRARGEAARAGLEPDVTILPPEGGRVLDTGELSVTAFPVVHAGMVAFGYRIEHGGRSVVLTGDTTVTPTLAEYGAEADVFLMEVLSPAMVSYLENSFSEARTQAILGLHLTAAQAADVMVETQPGLAVYYHTVASCQTDAALLAQTAEGYDGAVIVSRDLMQIDLTGQGIETRYLAEDPAACVPG